MTRPLTRPPCVQERELANAGYDDLEQAKLKQQGGKSHTGEIQYDEHLLTPAEVAKRYGVEIDAANPLKSKGLTSAEAASRLARDGHNVRPLCLPRSSGLNVTLTVRAANRF